MAVCERLVRRALGHVAIAPLSHQLHGNLSTWALQSVVLLKHVLTARFTSALWNTFIKNKLEVALLDILHGRSESSIFVLGKGNPGCINYF